MHEDKRKYLPQTDELKMPQTEIIVSFDDLFQQIEALDSYELFDIAPLMATIKKSHESGNLSPEQATALLEKIKNESTSDEITDSDELEDLSILEEIKNAKTGSVLLMNGKKYIAENVSYRIGTTPDEIAIMTVHFDNNSGQVSRKRIEHTDFNQVEKVTHQNEESDFTPSDFHNLQRGDMVISKSGTFRVVIKKQEGNDNLQFITVSKMQISLPEQININRLIKHIDAIGTIIKN